jgi:hypothetical protein
VDPRPTVIQHRTDRLDCSAAVLRSAHALRAAHHKLMQAFLEPEIFEAAVIARTPARPRHRQLRLVDKDPVS